jgi:hypothetical protein
MGRLGLERVRRVLTEEMVGEIVLILVVGVALLVKSFGQNRITDGHFSPGRHWDHDGADYTRPLVVNAMSS